MHHLSVAWHINYLKFSSWNITLWIKRAHQNTNFQIFECFNESLAWCQFWKYKVKVYSSFSFLFIVMKDNFSVFLLSQTFTLWTKRARRSEMFKLLNGWAKIHQMPYVMFETTSQSLFKLCITLQYHER